MNRSTQIELAVAALLEAIGEDPRRDGLRETPDRVARAWFELTAGIRYDPADDLAKTFDTDHHELVIVRDIPFYSLCEHHLLPFHGHAHVAYIPSGRVVGLSKIARCVRGFAARLQIQEVLTSQIADAIEERLEAGGVAVVIEAEHLCMSMRGVRAPGAITTTSALRGVFTSDGAGRSEVMTLLKGN